MPSEAVQTTLAPRLAAMQLCIPSPTGELRSIEASIGAIAGGNSSSSSSSYKPRQLLSCPAGPTSYKPFSTSAAMGAGGGLSLQLQTGPGGLGGSRFASSSNAWEGTLSSRAPGALSTTPVAGEEGGAAAAGAAADGLTGILALVRQLQGNLAGLESDMQQLHGALHRRCSTADSGLLHRHHPTQE
jgi:hypothetical protein